MDWNAVRKTNRIRSQRKARREAAAAARNRFVEEMGGPIALAEIKSAARRVEPGSGNRIISCDVWTFRGRDWVLGYSDGIEWQAFAPFVTWRMDGHEGKYVTMTPAARKWLNAALAPVEEPEPILPEQCREVCGQCYEAVEDCVCD